MMYIDDKQFAGLFRCFNAMQISVCTLLPNVEVLSLSANQIASLESFQYAVNLRELYLRKNDITDPAQLIYLVALPELRVLWLDDNPIQELPNYRLAVLAFLPHLLLLDNIGKPAARPKCGSHWPV